MTRQLFTSSLTQFSMKERNIKINYHIIQEKLLAKETYTEFVHSNDQLEYMSWQIL